MIKIYIDAAVNGNPGFAGVGLLILENGNQRQITIPLKKNTWNNHEAEFKALQLALEQLINNKDEIVFIYTDSKIVSDSIKKNYVKDKVFKNYLYQINKLIHNFSFVNINWIPESKNKGADNLARQALQKAIRQL